MHDFWHSKKKHSSFPWKIWNAGMKLKMTLIDCNLLSLVLEAMKVSMCRYKRTLIGAQTLSCPASTKGTGSSFQWSETPVWQRAKVWWLSWWRTLPPAVFLITLFTPVTLSKLLFPKRLHRTTNHRNRYKLNPSHVWSNCCKNSKETGTEIHWV